MKRLLFLALALAALTVQAQDAKLPAFITDSLDTYIKTAMKDWNVPGLSVGIVKDGKVVFMKGYGVKETGKKDGVDENTLFMIGSNTKAFTATALTILETEKKLSVNDKVTKWLPAFKLNDELAAKEVTLTDLLSHQIGFETFQGDFTYWGSSLTREDVIRRMALVKAPYSFRKKWGYCNAAYTAAGEVIPSATGKSWEETVKEKILQPLKMDRTLMLSTEFASAKNAAVPHTIWKNNLSRIPNYNIDNLAAAASMSSSAKDMCNWLMAQIDGGKFENRQAISRDAIMATWKPYAIRRFDPRSTVKTHFYLYGLGFVISDRDGKVVVSHSGAVDGFLSSVTIVPEEKLGIVILTNTDQNSLYQNLADEIRDAFLGLPYTGFSKKAVKGFNDEAAATNKWLDSLNQVVAKRHQPATELKNFTGKFTNELYGDIEIKPDNQNLMIHFSNHPGMTGKLEHLKDNNFLCTYSNTTMGIREIPFTLENGKVTGLTLTVADWLEFTPYQFVRKD